MTVFERVDRGFIGLAGATMLLAVPFVAFVGFTALEKDAPNAFSARASLEAHVRGVPTISAGQAVRGQAPARPAARP